MKINVRTYITPLIESNMYVVKSENATIIIDPSTSYSVVSKYLDGKLDAIFLTHCHYDHFNRLMTYLTSPLNDPNTNLLKKKIPIYLHPNAKKKLTSPVANCSKMFNEDFCDPLTDQNVIEIKESIINIKDMAIQVVETFGHTNCSLTYIIDENMFTGDFLFNMTIGRTDLATGNNVMMGLSLEWVKNLSKKGINYTIYPGHNDYTTLLEEMKFNRFLK